MTFPTRTVFDTGTLDGSREQSIVGCFHELCFSVFRGAGTYGVAKFVFPTWALAAGFNNNNNNNNNQDLNFNTITKYQPVPVQYSEPQLQHHYKMPIDVQYIQDPHSNTITKYQPVHVVGKIPMLARLTEAHIPTSKNQSID